MPSRAQLELRAAAISVDKSLTPGAQATQTLTSDATAPSNNETVTIGGIMYTYKTTLTPAPFEVLIGASAAVALDNLKSAINVDGTPGVYGAGTTLHPQVTATTNTNTTQVVQAIAAGTAGNSIATTETSAHLSWGAATLAGGTAQVGPSASMVAEEAGGANV